MAHYSTEIQEGELENKVREEWFSGFDGTQKLERVDFCVALKDSEQKLGKLVSFYWAEAKRGTSEDLYDSIAQLVLTIGKERLRESYLPPNYLGAFDSARIAFIEFNRIADVFSMADINWNVTPSNHSTPEFGLVRKRIEGALNAGLLIFDYDKQRKELTKFIKANFKQGKRSTGQIPVTKNNFVHVYFEWREKVRPTINVSWDEAKKENILDSDFFLADLLSENNKSILDKLQVLLKSDHYERRAGKNSLGELFSSIEFIDGQVAYNQFWNLYARPPKKEFWGYIIDRRDLLVPQDFRERKGAYYTPRIWVEKSQETIADVLGENWQDEYDVWDCCAGTGNLLNGLTNKGKIWASTLDSADVNVMQQRIKDGSAQLFANQVFQFDFLNDPLDSPKIPQGLRDILSDPDRRRKLVVYINPPYAEATTATTVTGTGRNKPKVAKGTAANVKYLPLISAAANEMFSLFLIRVAKEIPGCVLAQFSTLKHITGSNFSRFRSVFDSRLEKAFVVPAKTFDNVGGNFPIGFFVWHTASDKPKMGIEAEVFGTKAEWLGKKYLVPPTKRSINCWASAVDVATADIVGYMENPAPDFQNNKYLNIANSSGTRHVNYFAINYDTLVHASVYFAVRLVIKHTWLNDRDQFLWPNDSWKNDREFQLDCVAYTVFDDQNRIKCKAGTNHWIPFTEDEVGCTSAFASHFMSDWLQGKKTETSSTIKQKQEVLNLGDVPMAAEEPQALYDAPINSLSPEARAVFDAGRELWRYYHAQPNAIPDASLWDIRAHFQKFKPNGGMNPRSEDAGYNERIAALRAAVKALAAKIAPKVFEHGFLR